LARRQKKKEKIFQLVSLVNDEAKRLAIQAREEAISSVPIIFLVFQRDFVEGSSSSADGSGIWYLNLNNNNNLTFNFWGCWYEWGPL